MPVVQLGVVTVALAVTAVAAGSWWQLVPAGGIGLTCVALAALAGSAPPRPSVPRLDPAVATVAAVLAVPAVWAAAAVCLGFRQDTLGVSDNTWNLDHWPTQAALALAVPGVALAIAAGVRARWSGTWVAVVCVAVTAVWFGVSSAAYPDLSGSGGRWGGIGLVVWAVVLVVVVILRARRTAGSVGGRRPGL